jgi:hypothetical protein
MLRNPRITSEPCKKEADNQDAASDAEGLCWKGSRTVNNVFERLKKASKQDEKTSQVLQTVVPSFVFLVGFPSSFPLRMHKSSCRPKLQELRNI